MLADYMFHELAFSNANQIGATSASGLKATGVPYNLGTQVLTGGTSVDFSIFSKASVTDTANSLPIVVGADFSCWSPSQGRFINVEATNLLRQISE